MNKVSLIITNRNNRDLLKANLSNIKDIKDRYFQDIEVIVVDNNSTDGSLDMIKNNFDWTKVASCEYKGLSFSSNLGASLATGKYLIFLTSEAYPRVDTIGKLFEYMEKHPEVGIVTPRISLATGEPDRDAHRRFPTPWNSFTRLSGLHELFPNNPLFTSYFIKHANMIEPREIDACVYGFMMMTKDVFDKVGGFDPDYFAHGLDIDICYRIKQLGYKVMFLPYLESGHLKTNFRIPKSGLIDKLSLAQSSTEAMRVFLHKNYRKKYSPVLLGVMVGATYMLGGQRVILTVLKHIFKKGEK